MEDGEDDFMDFGDSMYSDSSAAKSSAANTLNSVSYTRNRAKITNPKVNNGLGLKDSFFVDTLKLNLNTGHGLHGLTLLTAMLG